MPGSSASNGAVCACRRRSSAERLGGASVLVTGGTGCIGSTLMAQLARLRPGRLVGVSRGVTTGWPRQAAAEYLVGDVRDRTRMDEIIAQVRPDVIFHLAAQRSPALAEVDVHATVTTNVLGARTVLTAAAAAGVPQVVCASTGKALRPYSPEIYTASKRAAEWMATTAAASGELLVSAARFTHVIDNSIFYERLLDWADAGTGLAAPAKTAWSGCTARRSPSTSSPRSNRPSSCCSPTWGPGRVSSGCTPSPTSAGRSA